MVNESIVSKFTQFLVLFKDLYNNVSQIEVEDYFCESNHLPNIWNQIEVALGFIMLPVQNNYGTES